MQKVATAGRFWWRTLDGRAPGPDASYPKGAHPSHGVWHYPAPRSRATTRKANPFRLEIPRADHRARQRRKSRNGIFGGTLLVACVVLAAAGGAEIMATGQIDRANIAGAMADKTSRALLALGFGIDQVSINGHRYTSDTDIFDALDLPNVRTFVDFDAAAALKRIERLPWVDTAQISRVFPGRLAIQIRERRPSAIWTRGDNTYLIDETGRVLGAIPAKNSWQLPRISGEGGNAEALMLFTALDRHPTIEKVFDHGERIAERRWSVVLKNGTRLELSADRETENLDLIEANARLRQALTGPPNVIDVRTPGRPAIRLLPLNSSVGTVGAREAALP